MTEREPITELGDDYGSADAVATEWARGRATIVNATVFWLTTVRPEGRPHVTPLLGVWHDGALYFTTGAEERKAKNLATNDQVVLTTGVNTLADGLDVVLEGQAVEVHDAAELGDVAGRYDEKYGKDEPWASLGENIRGRHALLYRVVPVTVFGFGKGAVYSQTRWSFPG